MNDIEKIQERIDLIPELIERIKALNPSNEEERKTLEEDIKIWEKVTSCIVVDSNPRAFDFCVHWQAPVRETSFQSRWIQKLQNAQGDLRVMLEVIRQVGPIEQSKRHPKPHKLFISHKTEDRKYADALVSLVNYIIGRDGDKIFCSSIPGYDIRPSQDIIDGIKRQFDEYEIFAVIIHSPRYYKSPICLNEMGAIWAINAKFCSFLTKDCRLEQLGGVIGRAKICINVNDEEERIQSHLNSFKDDLISFFGVTQTDETRWERERDTFVETVRRIKDTENTD